MFFIPAMQIPHSVSRVFKLIPYLEYDATGKIRIRPAEYYSEAKNPFFLLTSGLPHPIFKFYVVVVWDCGGNLMPPQGGMTDI